MLNDQVIYLLHIFTESLREMHFYLNEPINESNTPLRIILHHEEPVSNKLKLILGRSAYTFLKEDVTCLI